MNSDSKQRSELIKQIGEKLKKASNRLFHWDIKDLEKLAKLSEKDILLQRVATNSAIKEDPVRLILRFDYLCVDECIFHQIDEVKSRKILEKFKRFTSITLKEFPMAGLVRDEVENIPPYCSLFLNLTPDVDRLKETEISSGRIFYFLEEPENCIQVVAIETKHRSND